jgi:Gpi18-like mannosyltransferase
VFDWRYLAAPVFVAVMLPMLPIVGPRDGDLAVWLIPWMSEIHRLGWHSIAGGFSEYSPAYIYVLNLFAWVHDPVAAVKLANVPFIALLVFGVNALAGRTAAAVSLLLPTLLVNAFGYGQCDVIFTAFLVWFVVFAEREKPALAALMFGLAFSFKAQAVFLAPVVFYLLLAGRMKLRHAALIPLTYVAMMVPAAIAGRPWGELLTVYLNQTNVSDRLALNVPNPWWLLQFFVSYRTGVVAGLIAGVVASLALALWAWRTKPPILLMACLAAAILPFVLPKMTGRYFFVADVLTLAMAFRNPKTWPIAASIQAGSLIAYATHFLTFSTALFALVPSSLGVCLLCLYAFRDAPRRQNHPRLGSGRDHLVVARDYDGLDQSSLRC